MENRAGQFELALGRALKEAGQALAVSPDAAEEYRARFMDAARRVARASARSGRPFTAEDVTGIVGMPVEHGLPSNNSVGAWMRALAASGICRPCGYAEARRAARHANMMRSWMGVE